jgi:hypothetical protein
VFHPIHGCEDEDGGHVRIGPEIAKDIEARLSGEIEIENNEMELPSPGSLFSRNAISRNFHGVSGALELLLYGTGELLLVLDKQDSDTLSPFVLR